MPVVTLSRSWNPGVEHYVPGDRVEVSDDIASWLEASGALDSGKPKRVQRETTAPAVEAPAPVEAAPVEKRPSRAASVDEWKRFAESKGVPTKGLSKQQIIAATR